MLCMCGCEQETKLAPETSRRNGWIKGQPLRFVHGHNARGHFNGHWRGGRKVLKAGYVLLYSRDHPKAMDGKVYEHVLIAEKALGRHLPIGAEVHHVNGKRGDNRNANLVICQDHTYHMLLHARMKEVAHAHA